MQGTPEFKPGSNSRRGPGNKILTSAFSARGRHPPFKTAPVADSQRSLTRCSRTSARADSQRRRPHRASPLCAWRAAEPGSQLRQGIASRVSNRENRNTTADTSTRHGRARHRYRNRCVAHDRGTLRSTAGRGRPAKPHHRDRAATWQAALDHQRHYPGSAARKRVRRVFIRHSDSAPALDRRCKRSRHNEPIHRFHAGVS